jgi:integral membrane protein (TIGR01906 family)
LAAAFPAVLILTGVRLVMTDAFIQIEYHRPGFPADRYGFTREDRLRYGPDAVRYLLSDADISTLGDLTFEDGTPLYREKELQHMEDVKTVARAALRLYAVLGIAYLAAIAALAWKLETRPALRRGLAQGGIATMTLIVILGALMVANWDFFFDGFHALFFKGDSWQFYTSDTLIRLFPAQFWFDAALTIGLLTVLGAVGAIGGVWLLERRLHHLTQDQNGGENSPLLNVAD